MITLIVPTRNRAHTLRLVGASYFRQELVTEIIFVDDAGTDDTAEVIGAFASTYPATTTRLLRNPSRVGASQSRNVGVAAATNELILFCDDDEYLEPGYARICLEKLQAYDCAAVSGRRVYMLDTDTPQQAVQRFGTGLRRTRAFQPLICEYVNGAKFDGDLALPVTNAIILTRASLLRRFPYDDFYARGNGYREETDYQMNLFVNGYTIYVTNACHSIHLPAVQTRTGGQRTSGLARIYWSIYYTNYFFGKYYARYAKRMGLRAPRWFAVATFAAFVVYRQYLRQRLHLLVLRVFQRRHSIRVQQSASP
jgi:glycosyltransferase involved in cell wall biosynthesis